MQYVKSAKLLGLVCFPADKETLLIRKKVYLLQLLHCPHLSNRFGMDVCMYLVLKTPQCISTCLDKCQIMWESCSTLTENYQIQLSCGSCSCNPTGIDLFPLELSLGHTTWFFVSSVSAAVSFGIFLVFTLATVSENPAVFNTQLMSMLAAKFASLEQSVSHGLLKQEFAVLR